QQQSKHECLCFCKYNWFINISLSKNKFLPLPHSSSTCAACGAANVMEKQRWIVLLFLLITTLLVDTIEGDVLEGLRCIGRHDNEIKGRSEPLPLPPPEDLPTSWE